MVVHICFFLQREKSRSPPFSLQMNKKEKEKQKVINELFHTELTHVRHLQVLEELFSVPMRNEHIMSKEDLDTLFPNLSEVRRMLRTYCS